MTQLALLMRMIRLLRVLKVLRVFPELRMLVMALMQAKDSILFVVLLMLLVFYVFAIFAIMMFKKNDPWHFGNLHRAMMTLFRVATGEDWTDVMYTAQMGCQEYPANLQVLGACNCTFDGTNATTGLSDYTCTSEEAHGLSAILFFVVFHMLGGLVFLNLFIGVITVGMADAMEFRDAEQAMDRRVTKLKKQIAVTDSQVAGYYRAFDVLDMTDSLELEPESIKFALHSVYLDCDDAQCEAIMSAGTNPNREHADTHVAFDMDNFIRGMENQKIIMQLPNAALGTSGSLNAGGGGGRSVDSVKVNAKPNNKMVV
jgi:hypothetical protein